MQVQYKKNLYQLIIITSVLKLIFSYWIELGNDEAYYYTYALQPALNYFDHPPLVGILIRLSTLNLTGVNDACMRLGPIITCAISSILIFKTGNLLRNEKAGWYAALLYNCSVYTGFIAGWFILPDAAQLPFWCGALYIMCTLILQKQEYNTKQWMLLGLIIGLGCLAKIHALYLWAGFGLFIILKMPKWLLNFRLYAGAAVTVLVASPILIWNIQNNFITYKFHSNRVTDKHFSFDTLIQEVFGEIIYQNPVIIFIVVLALIYFIKQKVFKSNPVLIWLLCMSLPMIGLFWGIAAFNPTLPHWSGPAYIPLLLLAGLYIEMRANKLYPLKIKIAIGLVWAILCLGAVAANFYPGNFGSKNKENYGEYCPTLDISGWKNFSAEFSTLKQQDVADALMKPNSPILINTWFPAAQIEYYTARLTQTTVIATGNVTDVHQFAWLNKSTSLSIGDDAYVIVPSNYPLNVLSLYSKYFKEVQQPVIINQNRGGKVIRYFYVWRLKQCIDNSMVVHLNE